MAEQQTLTDIGKISRLVDEQAEAERRQYAETDDDQETLKRART